MFFRAPHFRWVIRLLKIRTIYTERHNTSQYLKRKENPDLAADRYADLQGCTGKTRLLLLQKSPFLKRISAVFTGYDFKTGEKNKLCLPYLPFSHMSGTAI
jgi:hypothetical protein